MKLLNNLLSACGYVACIAAMGGANPGYGQGAVPVVVKNSAVQAVPMKDVNHIALATPVNFTDSFTIGSNVFGGESKFFVVPINQRLVIQYVSAECDLFSGGDAVAKLASDQDHPNAVSFLGVFVPMRSVPFPALASGANRSTGGTPAQLVFTQIARFRSMLIGPMGYLVPRT